MERDVLERAAGGRVDKQRRGTPELGERAGQTLPTALAAVFQPREETYPSGALDIVSEKGIQTASIARMIGVHNHPDVPVGQVAIGEGYINAAADEVQITIHGRGGHGAYPHNASDPVAAVANAALSLPEIVRRTIGPMSAAVVVPPSENRSAPRASSSAIPIPSSTCDGRDTPAVHADPVEHSMPWASSSMRSESPSQPANRRCALPGSRDGPPSTRD